MPRLVSGRGWEAIDEHEREPRRPGGPPARQARAGREMLAVAGQKTGRLGVGAQDLLERLDDLAFGGVRAGAVEERGHQVASSVRPRLAQLAERLLDRGGVAARADGLHAVDLLALERRVDAEQLELAARRPR